MFLWKLTLLDIFPLTFNALSFSPSPPLSLRGRCALSQPPKWNHGARCFLKPHQTASRYPCDGANKCLNLPPLPHSYPFSSTTDQDVVIFKTTCSPPPFTSILHVFLSTLICSLLASNSSALLPEEFYLVLLLLHRWRLTLLESASKQTVVLLSTVR